MKFGAYSPALLAGGGGRDYLAGDMLRVWEAVEVRKEIPRRLGAFVMLRALRRCQRVLSRIATRVASPGLRGLAATLLGVSNPWRVRLECVTLLKEVRKTIEVLEAAILSPTDVELPSCDSLESKVLERASEIDDILARLCLFYVPPERHSETGRRYHTWSETAGSTYEGLFEGRGEIAPHDQRAERPLRDLLTDVWVELTAHGGAVIADLGAGAGRSRHHLALIAKKLEPGSPERKGRYIGLNVVETEEVRGCVACQEAVDEEDVWAVVERDGSSVKELGDDEMALRQGAASRELPRADFCLVVNVLHEIPLKDLGGFLANLGTLLHPRGVLCIYEMCGLNTMEKEYVLWQAEDVSEFFRTLGWRGVVAQGRTRNLRTGDWGTPYSLAYFWRSDGNSIPAGDADRVLVDWWRRRAIRQRAEVKGLGLNRRTLRATRAEKQRYLHLVASLAHGASQLLE